MGLDSSEDTFEEHVVDDLHEIKTIAGFNLFFLICLIIAMVAVVYLLHRTRILEEQIKETKELIMNDGNQQSVDMNPVIVSQAVIRDDNDTDDDITLTHEVNDAENDPVIIPHTR